MRQFLLASAITFASFLSAASGAHATPTLGLTIQSGSQSSFQQKTLATTGGTFNFSPVTVGNFTANAIGTELFFPDYIDLATFDVSSSAGGTLVVTLTGTKFTTPRGASNWFTQFTGNVADGMAGVSIKSYLDNSNTLNNPGCIVGCTLLSSLNLGSSGIMSAITDGSFALTEVITIQTAGSARLSLDASVSNVPEPISLALLGTGLASIGLIRRLHLSKAA